MKINKYNLSVYEKDKLHTEILFNLASAKAEEAEIVFFSYQCDADALLQLEKIFKSLKQSQKIDFYIRSSGLYSTTEGSYLLNKYPEISELVREDEPFYIVKL